MKTFVKFILQKMLGFKTYLYVFAQFVIIKLRWDKKEKDFFHFMKLIPDGGLVLDLGANIGVTSYHLSKKLPFSTVFSFEPLELNMNTLKRLKKRFNLKNIQEYLVAVGEENGTLEMVMPVINDVPMHGLSHVVHAENTENNEGLKYEVPVIYLDGFEPIKSAEKRVTAMKIDVENFEYFVLKGAEKLINQNRPIIYCELWDNDNRKKCIDLLNNLGYSALVLQKNKLVPFEEAIVEKHNFFFLADHV
ncbi:MAG: FkbM family methyltransferase [Prolixibacteraceae bacterium]|nr:FkbM family methyltransferase [Prolixibacteraceae bacterium]